MQSTRVYGLRGWTKTLLVLLVPRVEGGPFEAHGVVEALDLRRTEHLGGVRAVGVADPDAEDLHVAARRLLGGPLVDEGVGQDVGEGHVVLREGGHSQT